MALACSNRHSSRSIAVLLFIVTTPVHGFFEEIFSQMGGGGGGNGVRFEMGGGQQRRHKPQWPRGVTEDISKKMAWVKGTEWRWNNDNHWSMKLERTGEIDAPIQQCHTGCKWTATDDGKVYLSLGDAGIFQLQAQADKPENMKGYKMKGQSLQDRQKLTLTFIKIFDHEAADLEKDLYGALGVPDDADDAEIKKVYRKLSIKYHPDKNPDEASRVKFNEVRDAYEILSDPDKRILYDTGGMEAVKKGEKGDIQKTDDVHSDLAINLVDLYSGNEGYKASLQRRVVCRGCRMRPNEPKCKGCGRCPNEIKVVNVQMGPFMTQQQQEVPSKEKCKVTDATIDVNIEKGMSDGETLRFERMAEERPGMLPGSVNLKLKTNKHPVFTRRVNDLHMDMKISLQEALLGWSQTIRHLDGHSVELGTTAVTRYNQVIRVAGEGMPLRDDPASFGDLLVKVTVDFPSKLDAQQKEAIAKIFPSTPPRTEL
jgi:DnaJ-class molecular chaperone